MYKFLKSESAPKILVEAVKHLGVAEISGPKHNQEILDWAIYLDLQKVYNADEIPWCGLFVASNSAITGATKTKITYDSKGLVIGGADATTADISDSTNKRYVTDAQLTVINNTSGTNTGNETASTIGTLINGASTATPNDTDVVATAESSVLKKITWANVKAFLKTYFDTLYMPFRIRQLLTKSGDQTTTSLTAVAVTGFETASLGTGKYIINGSVAVSSTTTGGIRLGIVLPSGATM